MQDTVPVLLLIAIPLLLACAILVMRPGRADHFNRDAPPQPKLHEPDIESLNDLLKMYRSMCISCHHKESHW